MFLNFQLFGGDGNIDCKMAQASCQLPQPPPIGRARELTALHWGCCSSVLSALHCNQERKNKKK